MLKIFPRGDTPQKRPRCFYLDINFRSARQRSCCSCFTKRPLIWTAHKWICLWHSLFSQINRDMTTCNEVHVSRQNSVGEKSTELIKTKATAAGRVVNVEKWHSRAASDIRRAIRKQSFSFPSSSLPPSPDRNTRRWVEKERRTGKSDRKRDRMWDTHTEREREREREKKSITRADVVTETVDADKWTDGRNISLSSWRNISADNASCRTSFSAHARREQVATWHQSLGRAAFICHRNPTLAPVRRPQINQWLDASRTAMSPLTAEIQCRDWENRSPAAQQQ